MTWALGALYLYPLQLSFKSFGGNLGIWLRPPGCSDLGCGDIAFHSVFGGREYTLTHCFVKLIECLVKLWLRLGEIIPVS